MIGRLNDKELRIMDLLAQKRSANFIVHLLGVPFHKVLRIYNERGFKFKGESFNVGYYVKLFKQGGSSW